MKLSSTRNPGQSISFREALFQGLAPDGGLYQILTLPDLSEMFDRFTNKSSFLDIATGISCALLHEEIAESRIVDFCKTAFPFSPVLADPQTDRPMLELYHGPSCAFKDFGASFLATFMDTFLQEENRKSIILTATSGDTGSAVAQAFKEKEAIDVVILYPSKRVSPLQEMQLTTVGKNVHALEVKGSFDDCQRMAKEAFLDQALIKELPLTSANSINIGRLLPQSFYYVYGWSRLKDSYSRRRDAESGIWFCVPSGNFGNLTAGVLAARMGMDVAGFIAATNMNSIVPEYLKTGVYLPRPSVQTYSNAMDVGNPSNFERLNALFGNDWRAMAENIKSDVISDDETIMQMKKVWVQSKRFIDPHTAVGHLASERFLGNLSNSAESVAVTLSTAHPAKFSEVVEKATGAIPEQPPQLTDVFKKKSISTEINNTLLSLKTYLLDSLRK
jgi:threonine synthase